MNFLLIIVHRATKATGAHDARAAFRFQKKCPDYSIILTNTPYSSILSRRGSDAKQSTGVKKLGIQVLHIFLSSDFTTINIPIF